MQYFNIFICYFTFGILSLLYQITNKPKIMTQTELLKELDYLCKKGKTVSKKAYTGSTHSSVYGPQLKYIYNRIHEIKDILKTLTNKQLQPCNYYQTSF